jgi:FAD synthetase
MPNFSANEAKRKKMKKVMVFGTFDIFHKGHKNYFEQAKKFGNYLIAVIARDENVLKIKGELPLSNENKRKDIIIKSGLANEIVLGSLNDKYRIIKKYKPDILCLGYDQKLSICELKNKLIEFSLADTQVMRMKPFYPEKYKSSKLKK